MTAEIDTSIWLALRARITLAAGALPVAWPAETFTPPTSATGVLPYLAVGDTATSRRFVISSAGIQERTGIVTLVYVDALGFPQEYYVQKAAGLLQSFPVDGEECFQSVCVRFGNGLAVPRVERGYRDKGYFRVPVLIPWRCGV